ncbi:MAG: DNA helicase RecQ [Proteobacteria bacterium]|nr:DNA helicase RecQ [Pseudomonadota bacterium]
MTTGSSAPSTPDRASALLQSIFGYDQFRFQQATIVQTLIDGGDALVLMPTGGGKSVCFQIPAMIRDGVGIVISPLIALMQDQVDALNTLGIRAAYINSTQTSAMHAEVEQKLLDNELDLLYASPERLNTPEFIALLKRSSLALFAIDEAHCVSQWGHDFRSDYLQLRLLHEQFPRVPRIALTATADKRTREEIVEQLGLQDARVFIHSFDRANIFYRISEGQNNRERLWRFIRSNHAADAGIVYCLSRKRVEAVADWLRQQGRIALPYHAGMDADTRAAHQRRFLVEEGVIIVATIAFGMGIDKPDVRFVAHLNMPKTIEAYYQETGRAGRDGLPANAWLAYGMQDVISLRQMHQQSKASEDFKRHQHRKLESMLGLCEQVSCRRQTLLAYFDETLDQACGHCDNCTEPPTTWDATEAARKALSCVYRTGQRFGANYVIDVLMGKPHERISRNRHDQISTWGIGTELSVNQWRSLFRQLLVYDYLESDSDQYGGLRLTPRARPLLNGGENLMLREVSRTQQKSATRSARPSLEATDQPLFDALRALRKSLADERGVPPYVIFHDKTLHQMIASLPTNLLEMADINGVGEQKLERFGEAFLSVMREFNGVRPD